MFDVTLRNVDPDRGSVYIQMPFLLPQGALLSVTEMDGRGRSMPTRNFVIAAAPEVSVRETFEADERVTQVEITYIVQEGS